MSNPVSSIQHPASSIYNFAETVGLEPTTTWDFNPPLFHWSYISVILIWVKGRARTDNLLGHDQVLYHSATITMFENFQILSSTYLLEARLNWGFRLHISSLRWLGLNQRPFAYQANALNQLSYTVILPTATCKLALTPRRDSNPLVTGLKDRLLVPLRIQGVFRF